MTRTDTKPGDLILHAAICANPSKRATELVSYLVKSQPSLLEVRAANGVTPLMLACRFGRLDIVKMLIDAGADQTAKDRGRKNLMHVALQSVPTAKKLKGLLDLLDRETIIPMLKERNRLEDGGRTPIHQYLDTGNRSSLPAKMIEVFKLLVDISPKTVKQALTMLDGTGDTPLHVLLAKDADHELVRAITGFDQSLLFCENAVGRTPAEVAHDRYLAERIKAPYRNTWRPDTSVSTLVTAQPRSFIKEKSCDEPKDHESKTTVAKNWRLCAEIISQIGQPKRTLVSLHSANFVAQRLGEQHMKDRYQFQLAKKGEEDASQVSGSQNGDNGDGSGSSPNKVELSSTEKPKRRQEDIITARYASNNCAWQRPKKNGKKVDGEESDGSESNSKNESSNDEEE